MSLWRQLAFGFRALTRRSEVDEELDEEVRDYFERARVELLGQGLTPQEAERAARRRLGDAASAREDLRSYGWENMVESALGDLRYSARRLRRSPAFAVVGVLTLALGIGASTAVVSVVRQVLFAPLPYPGGQRVVILWDHDAEGARLAATYGTFHELEARSRSFARLAVADAWQPSLLAAGEPERLDGDRVSADYFRVLGISPARGRDFDAGDEARGAPLVAMVSAGLAERRFGGAQAVLGRSVRLDGELYSVIGVMPEGFENVLSPTADIWTPLRYRTEAPFDGPEWGHHLRMVGRLRAGVSAEQAGRELRAIGGSPTAEFPRPAWASLGGGLSVEALQGWVTSSVRPALLAILGAVLILPLIACVNVANLLLARGVERRPELAMRAALGAARGRLVRQLLTEGLLLALVGGTVGFAVAVAGVRALVALAPTDLPRLGTVGLDAPAFLIALAITTCVGLGVGLVPATLGVRGSGPAGARTTTGPGPQRLRRALVVAQVALALVLLVGAGLLLRSVERLFATAPGFEPEHVLAMRVVATGRRFGSDAAALQLFGQLLEAVERVPGVADAALTNQLPLSGDRELYGAFFESIAEAEQRDSNGALRYTVTPGWFDTLGIPLRSGRLLGAEDRPGAPRAVLINESFAKRRFGERDPIGQRLRIGGGPADRPWDTVVGVVGDVKQTSLALGPPDAFYVAMGQWAWTDLVQSLAVRARGDAAALAPAVKQAIWSVDPTLPILSVATMNDLLAASEARRTFALTVFGAFAAVALVLAALGLYGVMAGSVAERTREIGVRAALGASPGRLQAFVVRQGMTLSALGVALGLVGAAAATRGLRSLLFEVTSLDPPTYLGVIAVLAAVSAAASWLPAWRAGRVDPSITLRAE